MNINHKLTAILLTACLYSTSADAIKFGNDRQNWEEIRNKRVQDIHNSCVSLLIDHHYIDEADLTKMLNDYAYAARAELNRDKIYLSRARAIKLAAMAFSPITNIKQEKCSKESIQKILLSEIHDHKPLRTVEIDKQQLSVKHEIEIDSESNSIILTLNGIYDDEFFVVDHFIVRLTGEDGAIITTEKVSNIGNKEITKSMVAGSIYIPKKPNNALFVKLYEITRLSFFKKGYLGSFKLEVLSVDGYRIKPDTSVVIDFLTEPPSH